jgi:hypothetical protein
VRADWRARDVGLEIGGDAKFDQWLLRTVLRKGWDCVLEDGSALPLDLTYLVD